MIDVLNNILSACEELNHKVEFNCYGDEDSAAAVEEWFEAVNKGWEFVNPVNNLNGAKRLLPPFTTYVNWTLQQVVETADVNYLSERLDEELQQEPGMCEYSITPYTVDETGGIILKVEATKNE